MGYTPGHPLPAPASGLAPTPGMTSAPRHFLHRCQMGTWEWGRYHPRPWGPGRWQSAGPLQSWCFGLGGLGVLGAPDWGIQAQELKGRNGHRAGTTRRCPSGGLTTATPQFHMQYSGPRFNTSCAKYGNGDSSEQKVLKFLSSSSGLGVLFSQGGSWGVQAPPSCRIVSAATRTQSPGIPGATLAPTAHTQPSPATGEPASWQLDSGAPRGHHPGEAP